MAKTTISGLILIIICSISGYFIASQVETIPSWLGLIAGFIFAALALIIIRIIGKVALKVIIGATLGLFVGLGIAYLLSYPFSKFLENSIIKILTYFVLSCVFGYIGMILGGMKGEELKFPNFGILSRWPQKKGSIKILDTSAIIDGRIAEICRTGFIEGTLVVPRFILEELQRIADSSDPLKRTKGRRGLDILNAIQKYEGMDVRVVDQDFPKMREVDSKLVALAITMDGKIITNDYNLNKVAQLQGIQVLNVNELAYAVKPAVLPGETLNVQIIREGKEPEQGVAYLEDGTMVVVEEGKRHLGKSIEVTVTSVLQTAAGLMIFTAPKEDVGVGRVQQVTIPR